MRRVIIESPHAGQVHRNVLYAQACLLDCLHRSEAPIASHLLYPQVLNDERPEERELGIMAGLVWRRVADCAVFYEDFGYSTGMKFAMEVYTQENMATEARKLPPAVFAIVNTVANTEIAGRTVAHALAMTRIRKEYGR